MACLISGEIKTITSDTEGTLKPDSGGVNIPFIDRELGSKGIIVGSQVCYEEATINGILTAINLKLITSSSEITVTPEPGDISVGTNEFLTIRNGVTITGNIDVKEGALRVAEGATINGYIEAKKRSSVSIEELSRINGHTGGTANYLQTKHGISTIIENSTIEGQIEVKFSSQGFRCNNNYAIGGDIIVTKASKVHINGNGDIVRGLNVSKSEDITIENNTIALSLEVSKEGGTCRICNNAVGVSSTFPPECDDNC
ncbi:MAG: hypothetical protein JKX73_03055 [Flavobacteriales bacterium]|nr:hypothetical protein [Flavobacteriales bacterium]